MALAGDGEDPRPAPQPASGICTIAQGGDRLGWLRLDHTALGTGGCVLAVDSCSRQAHGCAWRGSNLALAVHRQLGSEPEFWWLCCVFPEKCLSTVGLPGAPMSAGASELSTSPFPSFPRGQEGPRPCSFLCRDGRHGASGEKSPPRPAAAARRFDISRGAPSFTSPPAHVPRTPDLCWAAPSRLP